MATRNSSDAAAPREKTAIQVIERMMMLLDVLAAHPDPVSLKELSQATQLHPSTAHRILNDMVVGRFVDRGDQAGTYRLGMRLLELGNLVKARLSVREAALAFAAEIAGSAPLAVESIRATLRGDLADRVGAATVHEAAEQARLRATADFAEGTRAMIERRPPAFRRA
jgi:DNA-binding IscR family transcriptional regulator